MIIINQIFILYHFANSSWRRIRLLRRLRTSSQALQSTTIVCPRYVAGRLCWETQGRSHCYNNASLTYISKRSQCDNVRDRQFSSSQSKNPRQLHPVETPCKCHWSSLSIAREVPIGPRGKATTVISSLNSGPLYARATNKLRTQKARGVTGNIW